MGLSKTTVRCAVNPGMVAATCHRCPIHCQGTCKRAAEAQAAPVEEKKDLSE